MPDQASQMHLDHFRFVHHSTIAVDNSPSNSLSRIDEPGDAFMA